MTETIDAGLETERLSNKDACERMGCSAQALYNRIKKYNWQTEKTADNRAYVFIPKDYLSNIDKEKESLDDEVDKPDSQDVTRLIQALSDSHSREINGLKESYQSCIQALNENDKLKDELIKSKSAEADAYKIQVEALNNQLTAVQNQLIRVRDLEKERKEASEKKKPGFFERLFGKL